MCLPCEAGPGCYGGRGGWRCSLDAGRALIAVAFASELQAVLVFASGAAFAVVVFVFGFSIWSSCSCNFSFNAI